MKTKVLPKILCNEIRLAFLLSALLTPFVILINHFIGISVILVTFSFALPMHLHKEDLCYSIAKLLEILSKRMLTIFTPLSFIASCFYPFPENISTPEKLLLIPSISIMPWLITFLFAKWLKKRYTWQKEFLELRDEYRYKKSLLDYADYFLLRKALLFLGFKIDRSNVKIRRVPILIKISEVPRITLINWIDNPVFWVSFSKDSQKIFFAELSLLHTEKEKDLALNILQNLSNEGLVFITPHDLEKLGKFRISGIIPIYPLELIKFLLSKISPKAGSRIVMKRTRKELQEVNRENSRIYKSINR